MGRTATNSMEGRHSTRDSGVNPEADTLSERCLEAARRLHGLDMRPIPVHIEFDENGRKVVSPLVDSWTPLRDGPAWPWERTASAFHEHWSAVNGLAVVLESGHYCLDTDSDEAERIVSDWPLPECPMAMTLRGVHRHLWGPPDLMVSDSVNLMPGVEVLSRRICIMPPSLRRYSWVAIPTGDTPQMPRSLIDRIRAASAAESRTAGPRPADERVAPGKARISPLPPITSADIAPWLEVLPNLRPDGRSGRRWRDFCPFHDDTSPSLVVYQRAQGKGRGHLYWIDLGKCEGSMIRDSAGAPKLIPNSKGRRRKRHGGTLRELKSLILRSHREQYDRADQAIDATRASGDMSEWLWIVSREIVTRARRHSLDLTDPNGIGLTMREVAKLTGCEEVLPSDSEPNGTLSRGGYYVYKIQKEARGLGFEVGGGLPLGRGRRGFPTRWRFPLAWLAPPSTPHQQGDLYPMPATTATDIGYRHDLGQRQGSETGAATDSDRGSLLRGGREDGLPASDSPLHMRRKGNGA